MLWGPQSDRAPDIFVVTKLGYGMSTHLNRNIFDKLKNHGAVISGSHRLEGIIAASGPDIKKGVTLAGELHVWDVASTILHIHGIAIPSTMDGKVIKEMFAEGGELMERSVTQEISSESLRIRERLRSMNRPRAGPERAN